MPPAPVAPVEALRVTEQRPVHAAGERGRMCLHDDVEVVVEEAVRVDVPAVAPAGLVHQLEERAPVVVVADDLASRDASGGDVEQPMTGQGDTTRDSGHGAERMRRHVSTWASQSAGHGRR